MKPDALIVFVAVLFKFSHGLQCIDHNGKPIDWYVVYKFPVGKSSNKLIEQGQEYIYMTSADSKGWTVANVPITDSNSIVGLTLQPLFSEKPGLHILYNDEAPDGSINFKKGHTKGLILADKNGGLWLIHSVPRFPSPNPDSFYPHNGLENGQSFLCISLDLENLNSVGVQLQYNLPHIYAQNIPPDLRLRVPKLVDVVNDVTVNSAPWYHLEFLKSPEGNKFLSFAKGPKFAKELYLDWVAPTLSADLMVETWLNGPGRLPSDCSQRFKVNNIESIAISEANFSFSSSKDHSKWAVVAKGDTTSKWICIGDINREQSQRGRGGGTVCFTADKVVEKYQEIVGNIEAC